jgi:hypothetical protein
VPTCVNLNIRMNKCELIDFVVILVKLDVLLDIVAVIVGRAAVVGVEIV